MRQRPTVDVHGTSRTISTKNLNGPTDTQAAAFPGSVGSGRSGVVSIIGAALSFHFANGKGRKADWRKVKWEQYREFMTALSSVGSDATQKGTGVAFFVGPP